MQHWYTRWARRLRTPGFGGTGLVTVAGLVSGFTGRIGYARYLDASVWTAEVNNLFNATKLDKITKSDLWLNERLCQALNYSLEGRESVAVGSQTATPDFFYRFSSGGE